METANQSPKAMPAELAIITEKVSIEKRTEVQNILNKIFDATERIKANVNAIEVKDENDFPAMELARTARLNIKRIRLDAEKLFDLKRSEVQAKMSEYKTEDQLWLKAKQVMQILTKEIEETAKFKEETRKRWEIEQREIKIKNRLAKLSQIAPEITREEIENLSDEAFDMLFENAKKKYEEKLEAERKAKEEEELRRKKEAEERERIRLENERLKKLAEEKARQLELERRKQEEERKALEEKMRKIEEEKARQLELERKKREEEKKALEEKMRKIAEEKAKQEALLKQERERQIQLQEQLKKKETDENPKNNVSTNGSDEEKMKLLLEQIRSIKFPIMKNEEAQKIVDNVKGGINKIILYIENKIKTNYQ